MRVAGQERDRVSDDLIVVLMIGWGVFNAINLDEPVVGFVADEE